MKRNVVKLVAMVGVVGAATIVAGAQAPSVQPATPLTTPTGWRSTARSARLVQADGRPVLSVDAAAGEGVVWQEPLALQDGTIEVELRGRDLVGQSFLGVAFRGVDDQTYEAVYFRPFNFATTDPDRRLRAVHTTRARTIPGQNCERNSRISTRSRSFPCRIPMAGSGSGSSSTVAH